MILVALGANLPSRFGDPDVTLQSALNAMKVAGLEVVAASSIWLSAPVPVSDQPWYRNAVVHVETKTNARTLLTELHDIERHFGRVREGVNAPRVLDLDLISYHDEIIDNVDCRVPHPRMHERAFVLYPLAEVSSTWVHPVLQLSVRDLIANMPSGQEIERGKALIL